MPVANSTGFAGDEMNLEEVLAVQNSLLILPCYLTDEVTRMRLENLETTFTESTRRRNSV